MHLDANTSHEIPQFPPARVGLTFHIGKPKRWGSVRPPSLALRARLRYLVQRDDDQEQLNQDLLKEFTFRNVLSYKWYLLKMRVWQWRTGKKAMQQ